MLINTYKNPDFSHQIVENRRKSTGVHFHDNHELYYLVNGSTKYFIGDKIFQIESGNFVIIPAGMQHKTDSETCLHNERILLGFSSQEFHQPVKDALALLFEENVIYIPDSRLDVMNSIFSKIETEYKSTDNLSQIMINIYISELIMQISRHKLNYNPTIPDTDRTIHKISKFITENFMSQGLSLNSLSRDFAMSSAHLSRRFKAVTGMGINEYITYVRLLNSERLLKETDLAITEIAGLCGFNDSNYFSTVFKKAKGITPLKFSHNAKKFTNQ